MQDEVIIDIENPQENGALISRDAVMGKVKELFSMGECYCDEHSIIGMINELPSVTQKSGKWLEKEGWDGDVYYECSVCGEPFCLIEGTPTDNMYNYCPNCGARMVETQESEEQTE